jgi:hypothetical protein
MRTEPETRSRSELTPAEDATALADRYVAVWMEADPAARRRRIEDLWAPGGAHVLEPPQIIRDAARAIGFPGAGLEARGLAALEARVERAHQEFVAPGRFVFRRDGAAVRLLDVVKFRWVMQGIADGAVAAGGLDLLVLDERGRIRVDYQFVER